jgi:hypothetical protein
VIKYPSVSDVIKLPFYLVALNILGSFYFFVLIFLLLWRWFLETPYSMYLKWKSGEKT